MDRSWLVQRLKKPYPGQGIDSGPFAFGGGLRNGGLREEALELFKDLWRFDYMGAAEFEFGEVPRTFQRIAAASEDPGLVGRALTIKLSDVQPHWDEIPKGARPTTKSHWKTKGEATVWIMCPRGWEAEVEKRVRAWAGERWNKDLKESTSLASTLRPHHDWERDGTQTLGWLEMSNGFMFFADEDMWKGACTLFGAETGD
jgi:hypothetical protein